MLPLVEGMPVVLSDHIDKGRFLLKSTQGTLVGLWFDPADAAAHVGEDGEGILQKQPVAALVKFPHLEEPVKLGIHSSRWCLNPSQKPKSQQVWITRKQLPIVPAYAITAHSSQGKTLDKAIVDLRIPRTFSPIAAYVALSRLRRLSDLLVYAKFDPEPLKYSKPGIRDVLREIRRNQGLSQRTCSECQEEREYTEYSADEWRRGDEARECNACLRARRQQQQQQRRAKARRCAARLGFFYYRGLVEIGNVCFLDN
jgi:hypothetical protein